MCVVWTPITVQSKHWMVAGGICISVTECWNNKPTFGRVRLLTAPFFPAFLPFQRTTDSDDNFGSVIRISIILI